MIPSTLDDLAVYARSFTRHQLSADCAFSGSAPKKKHVRRLESCPMPVAAAVLNEFQL
jgi:hypothetical protein